MRSNISYPKDMRKRFGDKLYTIDFSDGEVRETSQGPCDEEAVKFLRWAYVLLARQNDLGYSLPDLRRAFETRRKKAGDRDA